MGFNKFVLPVAALMATPVWAAEIVDGQKSSILYQHCLAEVASKLEQMYPDMAQATQHQHILDSCEAAEDAYTVDAILMSAQLMKKEMTAEEARAVLQQAYDTQGGRAQVNQDLRAAAIRWLTSSAR